MELESPNMVRKKLKTKLTNYIKSNSKQKLKSLLSSDSNLNLIRRERYFNPFVIAIRENRLQMFDALLESGLELSRDVKKNSRPSPSEKSDSDMAISGDEKSVAVDIRMGLGSNTLIEAIKCVSLEAVERLLRLRVDVDSNNYRQIPLQIAYNVYAVNRDKYLNGDLEDFDNYERSLKIFKLLVINKACPNIYNNKGYRLIHQIVLDKDFDLLEFLINTCGPSLNVNALTYGKMQNALHLTCECKKTATTNINALNLQLARLLINSGCDLNHRDYVSHETPIFRAIAGNNYELAKYMVSEGIDMSARNMFGNDVLSRCIQLGRFRIARLLIVADSPIRVHSCFYRTPCADELNRDLNNEAVFDRVDLDAHEFNSENFLQYSIAKYEEFLAFLQMYTQRPRSLVDLCRLSVRNQMRKPISRTIEGLGVLPKSIIDLILLKDIDKL